MSENRLAVFFTYGNGVSAWEGLGILSQREAYFNNLSREFDEISLITYDSSSSQYGSLPPVYGKANRNNFWYSITAPLVHRSVLKRASVFYTMQMMGAWTAVVARILYGKRLVIRQGYSWSRFEYRAGNIVRYLFARVVEFFALLFAHEVIVTAADQKRSLDQLNILRRKIHVIPNAVDVDHFKPLRKRKVPRSVLFVGRLNTQKNLPALIRAVARVGCKLTIIGDGELRSDLEQLVDSTGADVTFLGKIPNMELPKHIASHEIFVLPSHYEGNPKALIEAMSCGACVVASRVEGNREVVEHMQTGFLCDTSSEGIAEALNLLMADGNLQDSLGLSAREYIKKHFSLDASIAAELLVLKGKPEREITF